MRLIVILSSLVILTFIGCASYEGGKVIDGTNLDVGLSVPGTDGTLTINALAYTGGLKVCGDEKTIIIVTNNVAETNSYFGVIKMERHTIMSARIEPSKHCYLSATNNVNSSALKNK